MCGARVNQGTQQLITHMDCQLHGVSTGEAHDRVEQNQGILYFCCIFEWHVIIQLQQVDAFHRVGLQMFPRKLLSAVVAFALLPLGRHLGCYEALELGRRWGSIFGTRRCCGRCRKK
jgi:hypothetical protein